MGGLDFAEMFWIREAFANTWKIFRYFGKRNSLPYLFPFNKQTENKGGM